MPRNAMEYSGIIKKERRPSLTRLESSDVSYTSELGVSTIHQKTFSHSIPEEPVDSLSESPQILDKNRIMFYGGGALVFPKEEVELSNFKLDNFGVIGETVIRTQNISAQIIEVTDKYVVLECLVDEEHRIYQNRNIRREIIEDVIPFQLGQLVLIRMKDLKGGNSVEYINGDGIISPQDFNSDIYFEGLDNSFIDYEN